MALATRRIVTIPTEFGDIVVTLEYDNVAMLATGIICVNPSPNGVFVSATRDSDGQLISRTFGSGNTRLDIPTNGAQRWPLVLNSRGGFDGYGAGAEYPA